MYTFRALILLIVYNIRLKALRWESSYLVKFIVSFIFSHKGWIELYEVHDNPLTRRNTDGSSKLGGRLKDFIMDFLFNFEG